MKKRGLKVFCVVCLTCVVAISAIAQSRTSGKTILKIWDQWDYIGQSAGGLAIDAIHELYQKEHPNVIIDRSIFGGGFPIRDAVELALSSGDAPDVFYSWPSGAGLTAYAQAGYLLDLNPYAEKYGWRDRIPDWALQRNLYHGKLYAYPWEKDLEFIYYNKKIYRQLGLSEPTTWSGFLDNCQKIKDAGIIPVAFGAGERWVSVNNFTDTATMMGGKQLVVDVQQGKKKWNNPAFQEALKRLKTMADRGFFTPDFSGASYDDSLLDFYRGKAAMIWTGTWVIQDVIGTFPNADDDLGVYFMPRDNPNDPPASHTSEGSAYYVWAHSKKKDLAAEYVNFVTQNSVLKFWIELGKVIPITKDPIDFSQFKIHPIAQKVFSIGEKYQKYFGDGFHTTSPPRVVEYLYQNTRGVLAGRVDIGQFLDECDRLMKQSAAEGVVWAP